MATIVSLGPMQHDYTGCSRQVRVQSSLAPLPGSVRFYSSTRPFKALTDVPQQSLKLSEQLLTRSGVSELTLTLSSSRYGMLGTASSAAGISTEAWLAGPNCADDALRILAGPVRQAFICSSSHSSKASNTAATRSAQVSKTQAGQQDLPSAVASDPACCIGCNTRAAGRPMQQCPLCREWSCSAPCRGVAASTVPAGSGGRPQRQGAGLRWSCPNKRCGQPAATAAALVHSSSNPKQSKPQQPQAAAGPVPLLSSGPPLVQQNSLDPLGPSPAAMPHTMLPSGPDVTLPNPGYPVGHHTDPTHPQSIPMYTAGPPAYTQPMQGGVLFVPPYQLLPPGGTGPSSMPFASPMMSSAPLPATMPYPPGWQMSGMFMQHPFMSPWPWAGYPPMAWPAVQSNACSLVVQKQQQQQQQQQQQRQADLSVSVLRAANAATGARSRGNSLCRKLLVCLTKMERQNAAVMMTSYQHRTSSQQMGAQLKSARWSTR